MDKIILHCDLNNFFASVECRKHPELANSPVAVCGNVKERHGIILAKNEAAKKYGVKTAETIWQAKLKCPDLLLFPPHMEEYVSWSQKVKSIYSQYTDLIEPFGIDECWLDVTGSRLLFGNGEEIANKIRKHIKTELKLTISVGVSFNKVFAKLGSDIKKPDAVTCITRDNFKKIVWELPSCDLLGVGKATCNQLKKYGIHTIGDVANTEKEFIIKILGKNGEQLWHSANGDGDTCVAHQNEFEAIKSIGNFTTCPKDLINEDDVWKVIYRLSETVAARLRKHELLANGIQISVKDNNLLTREFQTSLPVSTRHPKELANVGITLFKKHYHWENHVRALGIKAIYLTDENQSVQCSMFMNQQKINEQEQLEDKVCILRERYGQQSLLRASLMTKSTTTDEKHK
ncbi:MAG: DNA polymerase IV [Oscillospiraceae bacterium]